jgi:hypothetical protein
MEVHLICILQQLGVLGCLAYTQHQQLQLPTHTSNVISQSNLSHLNFFQPFLSRFSAFCSSCVPIYLLQQQQDHLVIFFEYMFFLTNNNGDFFMMEAHIIGTYTTPTATLQIYHPLLFLFLTIRMRVATIYCH